MRELLRTNDPTVIAFSTALLRGEDIDCFVLDVHTSVLEGSIGILPRRLMVADRDVFRARAVLRDNDVPDVLVMSFGPGGPHPRRLPRRPPPALAAAQRATAPPPIPVLLAAFVPARPGERVLDLGCGAGTAALCLAARVPGLDLHGLELQPDYADLARRNAAENGLAAHRPRRRPPPSARRAPPPASSTTCSPTRRSTAATPPRAADPGRDRAHREDDATLADWIAAGLRRLAPGGRLVLVHRADRLDEILAALSARAGAIEVLPIASRAGRPASRVLVRARKDRAGPLTLWPPLTFHDGSSHTRDGRVVYCRSAEAVARHG